MTPNFEEILLELSYRIPEGIVDLTNEAHLNELVVVLEEMRIYNSQAINFLKEKAKGDSGLEAAAEFFKGKTYKNDKGNDVSFTTAINYNDPSNSAHNAAMDDFEAFLDANKGEYGDIEKVKQPKAKKPKQNVFGKDAGAPVFPSNNDDDVTSKSSAPEEEPTFKSADADMGGSGDFKNVLFSTTKTKGGDEKKYAFIQKKKEGALKVLQNLTDEKGNINLLSEPGGKPVAVKSKVVQSVINKIFDGQKLSAEEIKAFNSVGKLVTNNESGTTKMYFSKKLLGRHPQQGYDSIEIATGNSEMSDAVRKFALANKLNVGKSSEGAIGKKVFTPKKMAEAVNPQEPEVVVDIGKTKNGVKIASVELTYKTVPNEASLVTALMKSGKSEKEARISAAKSVLQTEAYNQRLDDMLDAAEKSGGKIPMTNFGDVTTPKGRKETISNIIEGSMKRFQSELENYSKLYGKGDLVNKPENKKVFDSLNKLKELNSKFDLQSNPTVREEYKKELDNLLINMANSPDFADAVADYAEMKAGLQFLAEGKQVYFPASENFQTADIIVLPDEFSVRPKKGQSLEQAIAENLQFYEVSVTYVGGLSVKYKGGGGSANYNKILQTVYQNKETQKNLLNIQSIYGLAYPKNKNQQLNIPESSITESEKQLSEFQNWAVKAGIMTPEEVKILIEVGTKKADAILGKALKDVAKCKGANRKNFEKAVRLHHIMQQMTAFVNNKDMKYTRYANFNQEVYVNKDGVAVRVVDDIADGVGKPCYMNPHHNPGFSAVEDPDTGCVTAAPTNQNPSHIESSPPKNLLKV